MAHSSENFNTTALNATYSAQTDKPKAATRERELKLTIYADSDDEKHTLEREGGEEYSKTHGTTN